MKINNFVQFPRVNVTVGDKQNIRVHVLALLSKLKDEFHRYFPDVDLARDNLSSIRDPFTADINTVPTELQEEILELKNDFSVQDLYKQATLEKFWSSMLTT